MRECISDSKSHKTMWTWRFVFYLIHSYQPKNLGCRKRCKRYEKYSQSAPEFYEIQVILHHVINYHFFCHSFYIYHMAIVILMGIHGICTGQMLSPKQWSCYCRALESI